MSSEKMRILSCISPEACSFHTIKTAAGYLRLCLLDVTELLEDGAFQEAIGMVSGERAEKAIRMRFPAGRALRLGAGLALDALLSEVGLCEKDMAYTYGPFEKPSFSGLPGLYFNLSHSGRMALACLGRQEMGCDIEEVGKPQMQIARHHFHPDELAWLESLSTEEEKKEAFYRLWACKESYIKADGSGLSIALESFCVPVWEAGGYSRSAGLRPEEPAAPCCLEGSTPSTSLFDQGLSRNLMFGNRQGSTPSTPVFDQGSSTLPHGIRNPEGFFPGEDDFTGITVLPPSGGTVRTVRELYVPGYAAAVCYR